MRFTADTSETKTIKKNTILKKEFNLPKKKECNKPIYML